MRKEFAFHIFVGLTEFLGGTLMNFMQRFVYNPPRICSIRKRRNGGSATSYPPGIWFFGIRLDFDISPRSNRYHYRNRYKQRFNTGLLYCTCIHSYRRVSATQYVVDSECFLQKNVGYSSWVLEYQIAGSKCSKGLDLRFDLFQRICLSDQILILSEPSH